MLRFLILVIPHPAGPTGSTTASTPSPFSGFPGATVKKPDTPATTSAAAPASTTTTTTAPSPFGSNLFGSAPKPPATTAPTAEDKGKEKEASATGTAPATGGVTAGPGLGLGGGSSLFPSFGAKKPDDSAAKPAGTFSFCFFKIFSLRDFFSDLRFLISVCTVCVLINPER